ncbi:MAG: sigma 54-interacting transcriptional regulator [Polyangiaceae bacterium]
MAESDEHATEARIKVAPTTAPPPSIDARRKPRYALLVMSEHASAAAFTLPEEGEVTIGRAEQCALRIDDSLLSRVHAAVLRSGDDLMVVDRGSRNGTWLGSERLIPNQPRPLSLGDVIKLGKTSLALQFAGGGTRLRRVWTHVYFEARLEEECARAGQGGQPFAVARVHASATAAPVVEKTLLEVLRAIDVLATYTEGDYEAILVDTLPHVANALGHEIEERLKREGVAARVSLACYPQDGRTPESIVARLGNESESPGGAKDVVRTGALARLDPLVNKVAGSSISVLVLGETGVGKEVLARMLHERSPRRGGKLVCLNCASLSESLLESELFGHEKGAFTGALAAKAGLLESANGGTAFLDEVGEMPLSLQAKLLRVIEQREVLRVGALTPRPIDVRFVSATNRDLQREIALGRFRQDLFFRLNGFSIVIPPLRERVEEIEPLARHFVDLACKQSGRRRLGIADEALARLRSYEWPGNIRELKNVIDRAVLLCSGTLITADHVTREQMGRVVSPSVPVALEGASIYDGSFEPTVSTKVDIPALARSAPTLPPAPVTAEDDEDRARVIAALEKCAGNQTQAAKLLGVSRQTLVNRLEAYNLPRPRKRIP